MPLAGMTKQVLLRFSSDLTPEWGVAAHNKILEMVSTFKTDGWKDNGMKENGIRNFKDQAAAQEWVDFVTQLAATQNRELVTAEITDI